MDNVSPENFKALKNAGEEAARVDFKTQLDDIVTLLLA